MTFRSRSASVIWSEGSTADSGSGYNPSTSLAASRAACSASFPPYFQASQASSRRTGQLVLTLKKQWLNLVLPREKAAISFLQRRPLYPFSRLVVYLLAPPEFPTSPRQIRLVRNRTSNKNGPGQILVAARFLRCNHTRGIISPWLYRTCHGPFLHLFVVRFSPQNGVSTV